MVVVGMFDGVHLGHQQLLGRLINESRLRGLKSLVVTFRSHPSFVLGRRGSEMWLDEEQERISIIRTMGVEEVVVLDFTRELAALSACEFVDQVLLARFHMRALLLGYDSKFGSRSRDDFGLLPGFAVEKGFGLLRADAVCMEGLPVSSSGVREALRNGDMGLVSRFLGRGYSVSGPVVHGRHVGSGMGFPTANISLSSCRKMMPAPGVYEVRLSYDGRSWKGMANWGAQPTFGSQDLVLEVHLIAFQGDLYGCVVDIEFVRKMRDICRFDSPEALREQLEVDRRSLL